MKKLIDERTLNALNFNYNYLLLKNNELFVIRNFTFNKVIEKNFWGKLIERIYLTDIDIDTYSAEMEFVGTLKDDTAVYFIEIEDLYQLRRNWNNMRKQLGLFGFKIVNKEFLNTVFEAGREYQEYKGNANLEEKSWEYTFEKWCVKNNIK